jgi:WS/DGAT/MGAT family acyltransferase
VWVDDPDLHLARHLHHIVLAEKSGLDALGPVAAEIASFPLPRDRPLWEAWFVEGIDADHVAVIAKIHHSAVDGVSGIFALAAFFDLEPFPDLPAAAAPWEPAAPPGVGELTRAMVDGLRRRPGAMARSVRRAASAAVTMARARGEETPLPFSAPRLSYNRALTSRRSVAFTSIALDDVKQIRQDQGASVNDVLVALCAGVLRRYALRCRELPDRPLVAAIPVSERKAEHGTGGNQLSFMFYPLPVHLDGPIERLDFVVRSARVVKDVYSRAGEGLFTSLASLTPLGAVPVAMRVLSAAGAANVVPPAANVTISNIKGPDMPLFVAGAALSSIFPMGPLMVGVGLGVTVVSYRDAVAFGLMACPDLVPEVQELADEVHEELAEMLAAVTNIF